jgi:gamma-glutamylcyclotransferase (GGCT)/AIG2-like uncharacterized protein YtfP
VSENLLFIYGSLLPGYMPESMAAICRNLKTVAPARTSGKLYDLGPYPGATIGGDSVILGQLVEVDSEATWRALDEYEGCPRPGGPDGLYRRIRTLATLESGETVDCWIYVYNHSLADARVVESGCWRTHRGLM